MKRILVLVVLLSIPMDLWALKKPSANELKAIQDLVAEAKLPSKAFDRMAEIEMKIGLREEGGDKLSPPEPVSPYFGAKYYYQKYLADVEVYNKKHEAAIKRLTALTGEEREDYAAALRQYYADQKLSAGLYEKAMRATMTAYGIPIPKPGLVVNGAPKPRSAFYLPSHVGTEAAWNPTYTPKRKEGTPGETDSRGRTKIGPEAFLYPGRLAMILYHESLHYQELVGPKRSDFWNEPEHEVRIREQCEPYLRRIFEVNDADYNRHQNKLAEYRRDSYRWVQTKRLGSDPYNLKQRTAFPGAKLSDPFEEGTAKPMPETVEIARRAKELDENIQGYARNRHMSWLQDLAERACAHRGHIPEFISQKELDDLRYQPARYYEGMMSSTTPPGRPCGQALLQRMARFLRGGGPLTLDWIESNVIAAYVQSPDYQQAPIAAPEYVPPPAVLLPAPVQEPLIMPPAMLSPVQDMALIDLALKACSGGVTEEYLQKFDWFPRPEVDIAGSGFSGRLRTDCELAIFKYLCKLNKDASRLDASAINGQTGQRGGQGGDEGGRQQPDSRRRPWSKEPNPPYIRR